MTLRPWRAVAALAVLFACRLQPAGAPKDVTAPAPAFELRDQDGQEVALEQARARGPVVLVFYRGHWSPHCRAQLADLQRSAAELEQLHATVLAVSVDHPEESHMLAQELGLGFPLLSDPGAAITERYGVRMAHETLAVPAVFVIRPSGAIAWRFVSLREPERPTSDTVLAVVASLADH